MENNNTENINGGVERSTVTQAMGATASNPKLLYAIKLADELSDFVRTKHNVHAEIKKLVTRIQKALIEAKVESKNAEEEARKRSEAAEKGRKLEESKREQTNLENLASSQNKQKRGRQQSESPEVNKKAKRVKQTGKQQGKEEKEKEKEQREKEWTKVTNKGKRTSQENQKKGPKVARPKADALMVEAIGDTTYTEILCKVKGDPNLKELGDKVERIRRTRNGVMLFELKRDPLVKSSAFKEFLEKSLEGVAKVKALTHEVVVECRNIDEVTTEDEIRTAIMEQFQLGEAAEDARIRMRKAYGNMQTATIKLPGEAANKLLAVGKIKVGWTICSLRTTIQLERCYRCMGFGHQAKQCKGNDVSKACRRCGEEGHIGRTCDKPPTCMLCPAEEKRDHITGGSRCPMYKKAIASK